MNLDLKFLGPPQITRDGSPVDLPGHRPLALLAYLLLAKRPLRRQQLIDLFFDGPDDPQAALRWTLSKLRKAIGSEYILADRQEVSFNFESSYWLDVFAFENGETELYHGDFLEGLYLREAAQFEDWLLFERQRLREKHQAELERQMADHKRRGEYAEVIITAQQLLRLDNLREDWHFDLIQFYARLGKRAAALEVFERFRQTIRAAWDAEPAPETLALVEAIRSGQFEPHFTIPEREADEHGLKADEHGLKADEHGLKADQPGPAARPPERPEEPVGGSQTVRGESRSLGVRLLMIVLAAALLLVLSRALKLNSLSRISANISPATMVASEDASEDASEVATGTAPQELAGNTVRILGAFRDDYGRLFQASMLPFEQESGIDVVLISANEDYELDLETRLESGTIPDIVVIPQPGWLAKLAEQGKIVDLSTFMDRDSLYQQFPAPYLELATVDGRVLGIWHTIDIKSLVWYPKKAFEAKGYQTPETWDELMNLSDQIVADGGVPWCIGIESADFTGWVGTDWIEDILLRTASPEVYDAWVQHGLPFQSAEVRRAFEIMGRIWLNDAYVYGGTARIASESIFDSPDHLFDDPPGCYLHKQASFAYHFFPPGVAHGEDYDFFYLPPIDPQFGRPVLGSGNLLAMAADRPEVREVMRYLTMAEATRVFIENGGYLNAHKDTPLEWFPTPAELQFAQILLSADAYRFDGSDMMPDEVGLRSFYGGIVDWLNGEDLDTMLAEIDRSWPR